MIYSVIKLSIAHKGHFENCNSNTTSLYEHYGSKLGSYLGQPFVVGQLSNLDEITNNTDAVEILSSDGIWMEKTHYPFAEGISKYGIVSTNDSGTTYFALFYT